MKKKNLIILTEQYYLVLAFLLFAAIILSSCNSDNDSQPTPPLNIATLTYTIAAEENSQTKISFEINTTWGTSIDYEGNNQDWLTVSPDSGSMGKIDMTLIANENPNKEERIAYLSIIYGNEEKVLTVVQSGKLKQEDEQPSPNETDTTNITSDFDSDFAMALQRLDIISDASNITMGEIKNIETLDVHSQNLTSLKGIEHFISLISLDCKNNKLTSLTLNNQKLTELLCGYNELISINLNDCPNLQKLVCESNPLNTLDISQYKSLTYLACAFTNLSTLDLSNCPAIETLYCGNNNLTSLNIKNLQNLVFLDVQHNTLTELDLSNCPKLNALSCINNQLTSLDISNCKKVSALYCFGNPGENGKFIVYSWFDNDHIPSSSYFSTNGWTFENKTITIEYHMK